MCHTRPCQIFRTQDGRAHLVRHMSRTGRVLGGTLEKKKTGMGKSMFNMPNLRTDSIMGGQRYCTSPLTNGYIVPIMHCKQLSIVSGARWLINADEFTTRRFGRNFVDQNQRRRRPASIQDLWDQFDPGVRDRDAYANGQGLARSLMTPTLPDFQPVWRSPDDLQGDDR